MDKIMQMAIQQLGNNPQISNSPMGQNFLNIVNNGDQKAGEALAMNILSSMGMTKEEGIEQARRGLSSMFHR